MPYPGVGALLDGLAARGLPVAIFSNKPHEFTCLAVRGLLPSFSFARVLGVGEGTPRKPNPQGALAIAAEVGVPPAAWLYCGDTDTDMATASAAGMVAVGALWGFRSADELRAAGARHLLRRPEDLLELI